MSDKSIYISAARDVLLRMGKPMHYDSITKAAIELGLLKTFNKAPNVAISTILSKEISNNPRSIFKKVRPGVYDISSYSLLGQEMLKHRNLFGRIFGLKKALELNSPVMVCKRALFLTKTALECSDDHCTIILTNGTQSIRFRFDLVKEIKYKFVLANCDTEYADGYRKKIHLNREFLLSIEFLRNKLGFVSIEETFDLGLTFLEICFGLQKNGSVNLSGPSGPKRLQITAGGRTYDC